MIRIWFLSLSALFTVWAILLNPAFADDQDDVLVCPFPVERIFLLSPISTVAQVVGEVGRDGDEFYLKSFGSGKSSDSTTHRCLKNMTLRDIKRVWGNPLVKASSECTGIIGAKTFKLQGHGRITHKITFLIDIKFEDGKPISSRVRTASRPSSYWTEIE